MTEFTEHLEYALKFKDILSLLLTKFPTNSLLNLVNDEFRRIMEINYGYLYQGTSNLVCKYRQWLVDGDLDNIIKEMDRLSKDKQIVERVKSKQKQNDVNIDISLFIRECKTLKAQLTAQEKSKLTGMIKEWAALVPEDME
jgi:hypothetical protein